jgi:hypothetical protein
MTKRRRKVEAAAGASSERQSKSRRRSSQSYVKKIITKGQTTEEGMSEIDELKKIRIGSGKDRGREKSKGRGKESVRGRRKGERGARRTRRSGVNLQSEAVFLLNLNQVPNQTAIVLLDNFDVHNTMNLTFSLSSILSYLSPFF